MRRRCKERYTERCPCQGLPDTQHFVKEHFRHFSTLGIDKGGIVTTLATHTLEVYLRHYHLRFKGEPLAVIQAFAILVYHGIAAIDNILRTFAKTASGIDISAHGACTLLGEEAMKIDMLANQFVRGAEVENDIGPGERKLC